MSYIETFPVQHSTIMRLYSEKDEIMLNPDYQRMGGVWTLEKKQLLMDSILNDYDIPKIYLHAFTREQKKADGFSYAVIDGRQRLEAIWQFIEGRFALSEDFKYQADESIGLARLGYSDIASSYPKIKIKFDSFVLPVIGVDTDDQELIEDMFSRLNEAVPLNAAEKRNAIGGELVAAIREIASHDFFTRCVAFGNKRYQHREVAARFIFIEENLRTQGKIIDTKKEYLDALARNYREGKSALVVDVKKTVRVVLDFMSSIFLEKDELLRAQGNMVLYYLLSSSAIQEGSISSVSRESLYSFRDRVRENRLRAEDNYAEASFELLEFDRLSQQGTNDSSNIRERLGVISRSVGVRPITI
ncbi:hypothetical protein I1A_003914 [Pseudomonas fluorescens R124]|uniref:GmrSD restriction endonucleases N-terminal domain-containing protein n=1 Tax=Pseudomonas fluorescens R124 TaxID=743713 RepID=A0A7U9GTG1_PSEFL|nr:DUF262 domain-containing protein [Pseudomonas fluorescens]EJZ59562.1 hypothetical protein I1A_003914 [Pseudomonas fluorescens R124]